MPKAGDRVLAKWPAEDDWWYPAVICWAEGSRIEVQFDDGDRASLDSWQVRPLMIGEGSRVFGRWHGGPYYYPGTVSIQRGDAIHIEYEDGDREWTVVSLVRIHRADLPAASEMN